MTDSTAILDIPGYKAGTWILDASHSEVGFSVRHMMISKVRGHFNVKEATLVAPENPLEATLEAKVDAASLDTKDEGRDGHLRSADFFDVETYPEWKFVSTEVSRDGEEWTITGDLTIKDVTKPVTIVFEETGEAVDPFGNTRVGFEGKATINRKDWGLTWNAALETGGVLVSEKIKLEFDISAIQNAQEA